MDAKIKEIPITSEFITLGQFLKLADIIASGGEAKKYLASHQIHIDGLLDVRRGRKLRSGTIVEAEGQTYKVV
jgi:ribosome-associated protein